VSSPREQVEAMVERQRAAIVALLDGVGEAEARARLVPSATTLLGLVKHATFVETVWFPHRLGGRSRAELGIAEDVDDSFRLEPADTVASVRAAYQAAWATAAEIAARHDLDDTFESRHGETSLRQIFLHMIAELARHAGHGDILAEQLRAARGSMPAATGTPRP
jgi:uncharacterized damage-inducible protein DinB